MPQWHVNWLARDEPTQVRFDDAIAIKAPGMFGAADISVGIEFNIWYVPFLRVPIEYRFQTRMEKNGKLSWIPRPLNK
jgi:hypothetical protein